MAKKRRWDPETPLERLKKSGELIGESQKANDALRDYYLMGVGRSLKKLENLYHMRVTSSKHADIPPTTKISTLWTWSMRFDWQDRVASQKEIDDVEREALWAARRLEVQEQDWEMAGKLRDVAGRILDEAPFFVKQQRRLIKGEGGEPDQVVITMALNGQLAVQAAQAGSKLARLAAEMENERQKITLAMEKEVETFFDAAQQVLDESDFNRLLVRLGGGADSPSAAEGTPEQTEAEGD